MGSWAVLKHKTINTLFDPYYHMSGLAMDFLSQWRQLLQWITCLKKQKNYFLPNHKMISQPNIPFSIITYGTLHSEGSPVPCIYISMAPWIQTV